MGRMNDLQLRLCDIMHLGLAEQKRLAEESPQPLEAIVDLADALEPLPSIVYKWRRLSMDALLESFERHRRTHVGCPSDYGSILEPVRAPSWHLWSRQRVRGDSTAGSDALLEPQIYLLAVERALLWSMRTAAATGDADLLRELARIAGMVPEVAATVDLQQVIALAGERGPFAITVGECPYWQVFQPLTVTVDFVTHKFLR